MSILVVPLARRLITQARTMSSYIEWLMSRRLDWMGCTWRGASVEFKSWSETLGSSRGGRGEEKKPTTRVSTVFQKSIPTHVWSKSFFRQLICIVGTKISLKARATFCATSAKLSRGTFQGSRTDFYLLLLSRKWCKTIYMHHRSRRWFSTGSYYIIRAYVRWRRRLCVYIIYNNKSQWHVSQTDRSVYYN